ncbi:hypothetical protein GCK72_011873 [Caenorhabditis remanei]|uniref:protein-serine/threonine phosphatase n=1 Tax=Caenorhabditis remanei TaxID=31234 RepID=A0A6A5H9R2_CAERE|nr:hypothetical protein GCK72_011873 [Caenorhabditis remanei]KAF1763606.1 hypothetical protein GCK72_011873 [Caenorhabditis remanei]
MGAYLNRPVVDKEKEEGSGDGFSYACTTMQGWRANQEDAHNCVVDLHTGWHMFAVYDGHGGTEVSKFTSAKLPDFLKERKFWEADDIGSCLQTAFVDFDDFIRAEDSMKELKELSGDGEAPKRTPGEDGEDEADRIDTIEEASIPIAELLKKYGGAGLGKSLLSAFLAKGDAEIGSDSDEDEEEQEDEDEEEEEADDSQEDDGEVKKEDKEAGESQKDEEKAEETQKEGEKKETPKKKVQKRCSKSPIQSEAKKSKSDDAADSSAETAAPSSSSGPAADVATEEDDESDQEFVADEEEVEDEESDEDMEEGDIGPLMLGGGGEVPGEDSGTTACVVLVGNKKVIVANAGDSRAILCRAGKAIDLSVDHKPEDEVETARIHAAGGAIEDGRVNGGLNLSRALGDHAYKKNHKMELKDQMITAFPDIKIEDLTADDEFLVVACDGIWNSMESQQVVDFVRDLIAKGKTCAEICDALCDHCLADSTEGDGTGCDNMTVICTIFKH